MQHFRATPALFITGKLKHLYHTLSLTMNLTLFKCPQNPRLLCDVVQKWCSVLYQSYYSKSSESLLSHIQAYIVQQTGIVDLVVPERLRERQVSKGFKLQVNTSFKTDLQVGFDLHLLFTES